VGNIIKIPYLQKGAGIGNGTIIDHTLTLTWSSDPTKKEFIGTISSNGHQITWAGKAETWNLISNN